MIKLLVLQQWYGLSDPEIERQATDRISFRHFLGYPEIIPDRSTAWLFRERLIKAGKVNDIWEEFQRQLDAQGLTIKRGVMQDASFITADPGHAPAYMPRGEQAKTRRSRDGTWAKRAQNHILAINSIFSWTKTTNLSAESKLPPHLSMIAASISPGMVRLFIAIRATLE